MTEESLRIIKLKDSIKNYDKRIKRLYKNIGQLESQKERKEIELLKERIKEESDIKNLRQLVIIEVYVEGENMIEDFYNVIITYEKNGQREYIWLDMDQLSFTDLKTQLKELKLNTEFCIVKYIYTQPSTDTILNTELESKTIEEFGKFYYTGNKDLEDY